ncbi:MAG: hypothetical protein P8012_13090 [Desulfobacterales bacterium]
MNEEKEENNECISRKTGSNEDPSLCCCYILDPDGRYIDPCYRPAADCC